MAAGAVWLHQLWYGNNAGVELGRLEEEINAIVGAEALAYERKLVRSRPAMADWPVLLWVGAFFVGTGIYVWSLAPLKAPGTRRSENNTAGSGGRLGAASSAGAGPAPRTV